MIAAASAARSGSAPGGEWDVVFGLELLLDGIAALIARTAPDLEDA